MNGRFWYSNTARHVFRLFFAVRDLADNELNDTDRKLRDIARTTSNELDEDSQDVLKRYYHYNRHPEQIAIDLAVPEVDCFRAIRKAERRLAQQLQLLPPNG